MAFKTQLHNSISKTFYTSAKELSFLGAGQETGNVRKEWTVISGPMIKVAEKVTEGCIINLPQGKAT